MAYTDRAYFVGQGALYAARRAMNGAQSGGYIFLGDCDQFTIDPKQTFENITESQSGLGLTAAHVATETMLNVKMRLLQPDQANWEKALWGTASGAVAAGSAAAEALVAYPGPSTMFLANPGVSNVTLSAGTEDVDYTVDTVNGLINVLAASAVFTDEAGTAITASYDFDAYTGSIEAFTTFQPIFSLVLALKNTANLGSTGIAQPTKVECYQWAPDMAGTIELVSKKHITLELNGMLLQDQTRALPTADDPFSQFVKITRS